MGKTADVTVVQKAIIYTLHKDSGLMTDFPFGFHNKTNQTLFEGNYSAGMYSNQTIISVEPLDHFLKGLIVTRVMPSIYIFIILVSLPLNGLAMVTFTCRIREKKPAVIYMCHLACVDLLFILLLPLKIHYEMNASNWVFGEAACRLLTASYYGYKYCSVLLMMCMSVDRLLVVVFPIASLTWRSARKATCVCVVIWLLTLVGIVPLLVLNQTTTYQNRITCFDIFADSSVRLYFYVFLVLLCISFVLPLVVILVSYSIIIYVLCSKHDHSSSSSDNRKRSAIMASAVVTEFVVCFAPSNVLLMYHCICIINGSNGLYTYPPYMLAVCLASSSVFLDPLLYYYGSSHYRQQIRSGFSFLVSKAKRANIP
ncbi:proteinase-activated receptor 1-like [Carassius auratus]|uniref:Proteinase-activated receptor 1 n=1 Tax=Carassius auratus TaxID=7957 RepID=A0A6P6JB04_CARAU|nr:proteinase-activated receptor 1-like [Carassius auratus]